MLRLSREADYSLLAMMYISARPEGSLSFRREIAAHYNIPSEFLAKVLQKLSRHGLVRSFRGMNGGYVLGREADRITLADIIEAVDGPVGLVDCQCGDRVCEQEAVCTVQSALHGVRQEIRKVLEDVSLTDMRRRLQRENEPRLIALRAAHR
ncbi:MAG TPA: Rrf2 family transcriptional regulator [Candidatus Polarisedimenticolia bacterium]|jgi:Rrf2 family protein